MPKHELIDVLVVGAGPVGLFCANELARQGLKCRIIEKKAKLSDKSKALALHIRTLDVFEDCELLDEILAQGIKIDGMVIKSQGRELINANFSSLPSKRHYLIDLPQDKTEQILYDSLIKKGLTVEWETELTAIEQHSNSVLAHVKQADGSDEKIYAHWLIACDGSHSMIRKLLYAKFIGAAYKQTWWLADLHLNWDLPENKLFVYTSNDGPLACFPIGNRRYRIVMTAPKKATLTQPSMDDIEQSFKARCSDKATLSEPLWISQFGIEHKLIQKYRYGRVFLAGDAAHVHSPMGGQGLNTGIQDIYNLAWKLALVHKGLAKDPLLNSYHSERYPIAEQVLKKTGFMTYLILLKNPLLTKLRNALMKCLFSVNFIKQSILTDLAELSISYAKSPIVKRLGHNTNFKLGTFLVDYLLFDANAQKTIYLHQLTRGTSHHLLLFSGTAKNQITDLMVIAEHLQQLFNKLIQVHLIVTNIEENYSKSISVLIDKQQKMHQQFQINDSTALLIRPDKYIGLIQSPLNEKELSQMINDLYGLN